MNDSFVKRIAGELNEIKASGLFKTERVITSAQGAEIMVGGKKVLNFSPTITWGFPVIPR